MLVDDEAAIREAAQQWLELSGFSVQTCATAVQALALLDGDFPGVLISDVRMPGTDGLQLLERVVELDRDLPVVLTSGYSHVLAQEGTHGFELLKKPYAVEDLSRVLRRATRGGRSPPGARGGRAT